MATLADTAATTRALLASSWKTWRFRAAADRSYLLGVTFSRGVRGPILSDKTFLANAVASALVVHALLLVWTLPLAQRISRDRQPAMPGS
jgi:hypothetical protein